MKRNPLYSHPFKWVFPIIVNRLTVSKKPKGDSFTNEHGVEYTIWINEAQHIETKEEKFNRIFDVQDAVIIGTDDSVYVGCDFANGEDITAYTLFYDCQHCHGSGCDICGGSGKSMHPVSKEDAERYIKKYDVESGYVFPQYRTKKQ